MKEKDENKECGYDEWLAGFEGLDFERTAERIRDKLLESPEFDSKSQKFFKDAFAYVMNLHKQNKPLNTNLMRIHMVDIKGYKGLTVEEFGRTLLLLSMCGFSFGFEGKNEKY